MAEKLRLFATIHPKPEHYEAARDALLQIIPQTLEEPGCAIFILHEGRGGDGKLYLYEEFDDEAALEAHYAQPFILEVFARYQGWLAEPVQAIKLTKLS